MIEKLGERWSGSLELGVTATRPENLDFPSTMTDIDYETWMLSGSSVMQVGGVRIDQLLFTVHDLTKTYFVLLTRNLLRMEPSPVTDIRWIWMP